MSSSVNFPFSHSSAPSINSSTSAEPNYLTVVAKHCLLPTSQTPLSPTLAGRTMAVPSSSSALPSSSPSVTAPVSASVTSSSSSALSLPTLPPSSVLLPPGFQHSQLLPSAIGSFPLSLPSMPYYSQPTFYAPYPSQYVVNPYSVAGNPYLFPPVFPPLSNIDPRLYTLSFPSMALPVHLSMPTVQTVAPSSGTSSAALDSSRSQMVSSSGEREPEVISSSSSSLSSLLACSSTTEVQTETSSCLVASSTALESSSSSSSSFAASSRIKRRAEEAFPVPNVENKAIRIGEKVFQCYAEGSSENEKLLAKLKYPEIDACYRQALESYVSSLSNRKLPSYIAKVGESYVAAEDIAKGSFIGLASGTYAVINLLTPLMQNAINLGTVQVGHGSRRKMIISSAYCGNYTREFPRASNFNCEEMGVTVPDHHLQILITAAFDIPKGTPFILES